MGEGSAVVGTLFPCHGPARPIERLDEADAESILSSGGKELLGRYWGGYVAVLEQSNSVTILRDPSAALPCYFVRRNGLTAFASDVDLLLAAGLVEIGVDWEGLARHLFDAGVPVPATALAGVSELLPGFSLDVAGPGGQVPCWRPWDYVGRPLRDPHEAADRLGRTVRQCVQGWCSSRGRLLLSVSGGFDSAVVAACLAGSGLDTVCLTIYGEDAAGDERAYARPLCDHLGLELLERADRLDHIDIGSALDAHLPRPVGRTQALSYEAAHIAAAAEVAAKAFVTGNGGDSVFAHSQSAAAIADRYLAEGFRAGLLASVRDVVQQTGCSGWQAAMAAVRLVRGPRSYQCQPDRSYLHPELLKTLDASPPRHPWLMAPADAFPGKAAHIAAILRVQHCLEPGRSRFLPVLNPLMSQPIMEACLAIPSWRWREEGRDRAVARKAFKASLPNVVAARRVKGGPDGFAARILNHYRSSIRERLLDGHLVRQRIVDREELVQILGEERPVVGEERVRLLQLLNAEAWLDAWSARAASAGAAGAS
jgi:asparagine synthase (glutamine-hydrolysing)